MKKLLYSILLILMNAALLQAQVGDHSVADCQQEQRSIHGTLAQGKVLLVASNGLDCSVCMNHAPDLENFAIQNAGPVEVWAAMTYTYSNQTPTCQGVNNWVSNYGWSTVFAFTDSSRHWFETGTPRYYVYDPRDSSLAYAGFSRSAAFQEVRDLVGTIGVESQPVRDFSLIASEGRLEVRHWAHRQLRIQVVSLTGQTLRNEWLNDGKRVLSTEGLKSGIYIISLDNGKGYRTARKLYLQ